MKFTTSMRIRTSRQTRLGRKKPVHLTVSSQAEIKQTFTYSPYFAVPSELEGYAGSQTGGTGT
jgi:hypothetical protein